MQFTSISLAALAVIAPLAAADNCQKGLYYCGYNLLRRGNYYNQIDDSLRANGQTVDTNHVNFSFFYCLGGDNGEIEYQKYCPNCHDGGSDNSDTC